MRRAPPLLFALLLAAPFPAAAAPPRPAMIVEPYEIYKVMLVYAAEGDFGKVEKCLGHLSPVLARIKDRSGADAGQELRRALAGKNPAAVRAETRELIAQDIRADLLEALEGPGHSRRVSVKLAYLSYLTLEPRIKEKSAPLARKIEKLFKSLYKLVKAGDAGSEKEIQDHVRAIEKKLSSTLSEEEGSDG